MTNSAVNLDPRVGADEASQKAHQLLYSTLVRDRRRSRASCRSWPSRFERPDPVTYVATLRHGVLFHDGRELTSDDVVYTFRSFLDPTFRGRIGRVSSAAGGGRGVDRYTVAFKLKEPFGSFPINLVMGIVQAGSGDANARQPIGTGPYRAEDVRAGRSPRARARSTATTAAARANAGLVLKVVPDDTMRGLELRKGTVDLVVNDLAPDIVWQLAAEGRLRSRYRGRAPTTPTSA